MADNCKICGLCEFCNKPRIRGRGNIENPVLLIIGESPSRIDDQEGKIFAGAGQTGKFLSEVLGDGEKNVFITNAVKCCSYKDHFDPTRGAQPPNEQQIEWCNPFLLQELNMFDPAKTAIMTLGAESLTALVGKHKDMEKEVGDIKFEKIGNKTWKVIPNYHPSYIINKMGSSFEKEFRSVVKQALNHDREEPEEEKIYLIADPATAIKETKLIIEAKKKGEIDYIVYDCETTGFLPWRDRIIMYSFFNSKVNEKAIAVPIHISNINHHGDDYPYKNKIVPIEWDLSVKDIAKINRAVGEMIETVPIVAHNAKFDTAYAVAHNIAKLENIKVHYDTLLLAHIIIGRQMFGALDLKTLCVKIFGVPNWEIPKDSYLKLFRKLSERTYDKVPTSILSEYAAKDAYYTDALLNTFLKNKDIDTLLNTYKLLHNILPVFTEAEIKGIYFDLSNFGYIKEAYENMAKKEKDTMSGLIEDWIYPRRVEALAENAKKKKPLSEEELEKEIFNPGSTQQRSSILFDYFKMKSVKKGKSGSDSSDKDVIDALLRDKKTTEEGKQFLTSLSEYTGLKKLITSYLDNTDDMLDGSIYHPSYQINGTITGRHSSGWHTMPKHSDLKRLFISRWSEEGGLFGSFDFSQLELRVVASLSDEEKWLKAFEDGLDIHAQTASIIFGKPINKITSDQRKAAKTCLGEKSYVFTDKGIKHPSQLVEDDYLFDKSLNEQKWKMMVDPPEDTIILEFDNGIEEEYRPDHKLLVWNGVEIEWKEVQQISNKDEIISAFGQMKDIKKEDDWFVDISKYYTQNRIKSKSTLNINSNDWCYLLGLYLGDGNIQFKYSKITGKRKEGTFSVIIKNEKTKNWLFDFLKKNEFHYNISTEKVAKRGFTYYTIVVNSLGLCSTIEELFPAKDISDDFISKIGFSGILNLLAGLVDSDGTLSMNLKCLKITNEAMVRKICLLSMAIGIPTKVKKYKAGITDKKGNRSYTYKNSSNFYKDCYEIHFHEIDTKIPVLSDKVGKERKKLWGFSIDTELANNIYRQVLKLEGGYSKKPVITWDNIRRGHSIVNPKTPYIELVKGIEPHYYICKMISKKKSESKIYLIQTEKGNYLSSMISANTNFGLIYGLSDAGLADQLGISTKAAKKIKDGLFTGCSSLGDWFQKCYDEVNTSHEVVTIFGRTIPINKIKISKESDEKEEDKEANQRRAVNYKVQCILGDTKIPLFSGKEVKIKDLDGIKDVWLYSMDLAEKEIVPSFASKIFKSGEVTQLIKVTLDNNKSVTCTPEHLFMLRDGSYTSAEKLSVNDSLMPYKKEYIRRLKESKTIKVRSTEKITLDTPVSVYDMEVPNYHNFAVSAGIFIHNSPASDLVTDSIGRIYKAMYSKKLKSIIVGSVHDSILFDIYPGELIPIIKLVKHICEVENGRLYPWIKCPITVDASIGTSWGGCLDFDVEYTDKGIKLTCKEGLRKDFRMLFNAAEKIYKWEYTILKETEIKEKDQPKDKVIKVKYNWAVEILI